jgi:hypothetical protein
VSADDDDDDGTDRERTSDDDDDDAGNVAITRKKEEIQVEFDFEAPDEIDFQGLKSLLTPYLDGTEWQVGTLCDAIIGQFWCGNVVKPEDGSRRDRYGVESTLLPLGPTVCESGGYLPFFTTTHLGQHHPKVPRGHVP